MGAVFAALALAGTGVTVASLLWLHVSGTGLSPVSAAVSQYGISSHRAGYRVATIALGVAAIALGISLQATLDRPNPIGFTFLLLFGAARLVISWAPMDEPGAARTRTGSMHNVLATVFFASATVAAFLYGGSFVHDDALGGIAGPSTVLAWCMAVVSAAILVTSLAKPLRPYFGLIERLLYVAVVTWMITVAVAVINA